MTKPIVSQAELVTTHFEGMCCQAAEVSHSENVELMTLLDLDPEHGDSLKLTGEHGELSNIVKIKCQGDHVVDEDLAQVEHSSHGDIIETVALHLQVLDVGELHLLQFS